jgi:hypothetical protein
MKGSHLAVLYGFGSAHAGEPVGHRWMFNCVKISHFSKRKDFSLLQTMSSIFQLTGICSHARKEPNAILKLTNLRLGAGCNLQRG